MNKRSESRSCDSSAKEATKTFSLNQLLACAVLIVAATSTSAADLDTHVADLVQEGNFEQAKVWSTENLRSCQTAAVPDVNAIAEARFLLAFASSESGEIDAAIDLFNEIINDDKVRNASLQKLVQFNLAVTLCQACRFGEALATASNLLSTDTENSGSAFHAQCHYLLGEILHSQGKVNEARSEFNFAKKTLVKNCLDESWKMEPYAPFVEPIVYDRPSYPCLIYSYTAPAPSNLKIPYPGKSLSVSERAADLAGWFARLSWYRGDWYSEASFEHTLSVRKQLANLQNRPFDRSYQLLVAEANLPGRINAKSIAAMDKFHPHGHRSLFRMRLQEIRDRGGRIYNPERIESKPVEALVRNCVRDLAGSRFPDAQIESDLVELNALRLLFKREFPEATKAFHSLWDFRKSVYGVSHWKTRLACNGLGISYYRCGDLDHAIHYLQTACRLDKADLIAKLPHASKLFNDLGIVAAKAGRYEQARTALEHAVSLAEQDVSLNAQTIKQNLANLRLTLGDRQPERALLESLSTASLTLTQRAQALISLATLSRKEGKPDKALEYLQRAQAAGTNSPELVNMLGATYRELGDVSNAGLSFRRSLSLQEESSWVSDKTKLYSLLGLALLERKKGKPEAALEWIAKAESLVAESKQQNLPISFRYLEILAETLLQAGRAEQAFEKFVELSLDRHTLLCKTLPSLSMTEMLQFESSLNASAAAILAAAEAEVDAAEAYQLLYRAKASTNEVLLSQRSLRTTEKATKLWAELTQIRREISKRILGRPPSRASWNEISSNETLQQLTKRREAVERELAQHSDGFRYSFELRNRSSADCFKRISTDVVAVDFCLCVTGTDQLADPHVRKMHYTAFVIRRKSPRGKLTIELVRLGDQQTIDALIRSWLNELESEEDSLEKSGRELSRLLWEPLMHYVNEAKRVGVVPCGLLHSIPWAALPTDQSNRRLIEGHSVVSAPSLQMLFTEISPANEISAALDKTNALLIGGINFSTQRDSDEARGSIWRPLEHTKDEVKAITTLAMGIETVNPTALLNAEADEKTICQILPRFENVHLASHGFFFNNPVITHDAMDLFNNDSLSRNPLARVGIVVSEPKPDAIYEDQYLSGEDILSLDLSKCQLAVLSACQTNVGHVDSGNGVFGIQKAFQLAGAKNTIASLWEVDDQATKVLMTRFYENLWQKKMSVSQSLRSAQLWMLDHPQQVFAGGKPAGSRAGFSFKRKSKPRNDDRGAVNRLPPKYWAAFSVSGSID